MNAFAEKIRSLRLAAKLTEKQLAKKCGLAESYIVQIESGKKVINETTAEKILLALGQKNDFGFEGLSHESEPIHTVTKIIPPVQPKASVSIEPLNPQNQWADALSGILRTYPIISFATGQKVGQKELPIIGKKVENYAPDKIQFIQITDNDMSAYRIQKGDVILLESIKEPQREGIFLIEWKQRQLIRALKREPGNKWKMWNGSKEEVPLLLDANTIKVIACCIRVEYTLEQKY